MPVNEFDLLSPEEQAEIREAVKRDNERLAATVTPQERAAIRAGLARAAAEAEYIRYMSKFDPPGPPF